MTIQTNQIEKKQLWGVVIAQAIVLVILLLFVLRACTTNFGSMNAQALTLQSEPSVAQDMLITHAETEIQNDNVIGGLALLDVTIQQGQPSARVYGARAAAYARIGDYDNAVTDYRQAVVLAPDNADFQFGLCFVEVTMGNYQDAISPCSSAIQLNPTNLLAWNNRCYIRAYHLGDYEGAISDCTQTIAINSVHPYAYNNRARAYLMTGAYQQAINDATRSLQLENSYSHLPLTNRGTAYLALGQAQPAFNDYQAAINANPNYDEVYARLGEYYRWQNQPTLARDAYCQYLSMTDTPIQLIVDRANELGGC